VSDTLASFAIDTLHRKKGFGSQLMLAFLSTLDTPVTLHVRKSNTIAQSLYKKHKFHVIKTENSYYDKPSECALVMSNKCLEE
jgi:ribosomal protein S18 acetylase RimI-like enzyme